MDVYPRRGILRGQGDNFCPPLRETAGRLSPLVIFVFWQFSLSILFSKCSPFCNAYATAAFGSFYLTLRPSHNRTLSSCNLKAGQIRSFEFHCPAWLLFWYRTLARCFLFSFVCHYAFATFNCCAFKSILTTFRQRAHLISTFPFASSFASNSRILQCGQYILFIVFHPFVCLNSQSR